MKPDFHNGHKTRQKSTALGRNLPGKVGWEGAE